MRILANINQYRIEESHVQEPGFGRAVREGGGSSRGRRARREGGGSSRGRRLVARAAGSSRGRRLVARAAARREGGGLVARAAAHSRGRRGRRLVGGGSGSCRGFARGFVGSMVWMGPVAGCPAGQHAQERGLSGFRAARGVTAWRATDLLQRRRVRTAAMASSRSLVVRRQG